MWHTKSRVWRWKVEPGMEDAFDDLLGWMLSSQRDTETETAAIETAKLSAVGSPFRTCCRRPMRFRCCARAA